VICPGMQFAEVKSTIDMKKFFKLAQEKNFAKINGDTIVWQKILRQELWTEKKLDF
jgi:hypothetical protein